MNNNISLTLKQLLKAGLHIGHQKKRWNPKMSMYLVGIIKDIHIINLEYTITVLRIIINFINDTIINKGKIMFLIDNINNINNVINTVSNKHIKYLYGDEINGIFTNKNLSTRSELPKIFIPDILFITNMNNYLYTINEANKLRIPIISFVDSNCNPELITYPIPGNNDSLQSFQLISNLINQTILYSIIKENIIFKNKIKRIKRI